MTNKERRVLYKLSFRRYNLTSLNEQSTMSSIKGFCWDKKMSRYAYAGYYEITPTNRYRIVLLTAISFLECPLLFRQQSISIASCHCLLLFVISYTSAAQCNEVSYGCVLYSSFCILFGVCSIEEYDGSYYVSSSVNSIHNFFIAITIFVMLMWRIDLYAVPSFV